MGVYAAMSGAGAAVGLILGGALTEIDWRWTFFINVPIGLLVAAPRAARASSSPSARAAASTCLGAITGTARSRRHRLRPDPRGRPAAGWTRPGRPSPRSIAGVVLLGRVRPGRARARRTPCCRSGSSPTAPAASASSSCSSSAPAMFAMFYFLGLYIQQVLGYCPLKAGLRVPAVHRRHRRRRRLASTLASQDRPALDRRSRCAARVRRHVRLQPAHRRQHATPPTCCRGSLRPRLRAGPDLRAAHAHRGGRRREPRTPAPARPRSTPRSRSVAPSASPPSPPCSRTPSPTGWPRSRARSRRRRSPGRSTRATRPRPPWPRAARRADLRLHPGLPVGAAMILVGSLVVFFGLNVKHEELASREGVAGPHLG